MASVELSTRWLFAGQLGPLFDDGERILIIEAQSVFGRRPTHRAKAHLILSALRHRAAELGEPVTFLQVETYGEGLDRLDQRIRDGLEVIDPTSHAARRFVRKRGMHILPSRGFVSSEEEFAAWAKTRDGKRLLMEDFYRDVRERTGILMDGPQLAGGHWNYDHDNRQSPPKRAAGLGLPDPWWPVEDEIDAQVREDLDRWQAEGRAQLVGDDGPRRFAVTSTEQNLRSTSVSSGGARRKSLCGWTRRDRVTGQAEMVTISASTPAIHQPRALVALFVLYLVLLAWIILWKLDVPYVGAAAGLPRPWKLLPFVASGDAGASAPLEIVANVILFVPFGIYLGMLAPAWRWWQLTGVFVGASLVLEVTQHLLSTGSFDTTDVITNTAGGLVGLGLLALARRWWRERASGIVTRILLIGGVVAVLAVVAFIVSPLHYGQVHDVVVPLPTVSRAR